MHDDDLKQLLQSAETDHPRFTRSPRDLSSRVRAAHAHRRRRRQIAVTCAPILLFALAATGWLLRPQEHQTSPGVSQPVAAIDEAELHRLVAQAEQHATRARLMMTETRASVDKDPLVDIREQIDIVAYDMLLRADSQRESQGNQEAAEIYRNVRHLFPNTYSAQAAQRRLEESNSSGESS